MITKNLLVVGGACKYSLLPSAAGDCAAHNDRRRSLMDQLTYRSGKWDIITATLNNNILIYCAPVCSAALSHTQVTTAAIHDPTAAWLKSTILW